MSFTITLRSTPRSRRSSKNSVERQTMDSGPKFRRYSQQQTIMQVQTCANLRQMRNKRKQYQEQYKRKSCRLQFYQKKQQKMINQTLSQQQKLQIYNNHLQDKKKQQNDIKNQQQKKAFQKWVKSQEVKQFRKTSQNKKMRNIKLIEDIKYKSLQGFKKKMFVEKQIAERMKRQANELKKEKHDKLLSEKEDNYVKKKIREEKRHILSKSLALERIQQYEQDTTKTLQMIKAMKTKQILLQNKNKSYSKVLKNILQNFQNFQKF